MTRIQSAARASQLLLWLAERPDGATAKEVAFAHRLRLATTYRLLNTLLDAGMLTRRRDRRYTLGAGSHVLARAYLRGPVVPERYLARLRELARGTRATAHLADWGEHGMRSVASVDGPDPLRCAELSGGPLADAHARANGKLLLAYAPRERREAHLRRAGLRRLTAATVCDRASLDAELQRVRARGWACEQQEFAEGFACVSAPVERDGRVVAAFGLLVTAERFTRERDRLTAAALEAAAAA